MFKSAFVEYYDDSVVSVKSRTRGLIRLEERREAREGIAGGLTEHRQEGGSVGLGTQNLYDDQGNVVGDAATQYAAQQGHWRPMRRVFDFDVDPLTNRAPTAQRRAYVLRAGLENLPRNKCEPRLIADSPCTQELVDNPRLSKKTRDFLQRTNYIPGINIELCQYHDDWQRILNRRRSQQIMTTLLYVLLDRGDLPRAWRVFCVLIREPYIEIRKLWTVALKLLAWREKKTGQHPGTLQTRFLDWAIVHAKDEKTSNEYVISDILIKMDAGDVKAAFERAEGASMQSLYYSNPMIWCLAGMTYMKLNPDDRARTYSFFRRCIELGGYLPKYLYEDEQNFVDDDSIGSDDSDNDKNSDKNDE